jgi:hypothetical protein
VLHIVTAELPAPSSLLLIDVEAKRDMLEQLKRDAIARWHLRDDQVRIAFSGPAGMPPELYGRRPSKAPASKVSSHSDARSKSPVSKNTLAPTLIIAATSRAHVIDVNALLPGTILVDDSYPEAFRPAAAERRMNKRKDVLITIAGAIQLPPNTTPIKHIPVFRPRDAKLSPAFQLLHRMMVPTDHSLTSCVLSSVLTLRFDLAAVTGSLDLAPAVAAFDLLRREQFTGAPPHLFCPPLVVEEKVVLAFNRRFGGAAASRRRIVSKL